MEPDPQTPPQSANIDQQIEAILMRVWAAALDAKAMVDQEGATEEMYLRKQRYHVERAKAEILRLSEVGVEVTIEGGGGPGAA